MNEMKAENPEDNKILVWKLGVHAHVRFRWGVFKWFLIPCLTGTICITVISRSTWEGE